MKTAQNLLIALSALFGIVIAKAIVKDAFNSPSPSSNRIQDPELLETGLKTAAKQVQTQAPIQVDEATQMTGASAAGNEITYFMTVNKVIQEADLATQLKARVCANEKTQLLIEAGATLRYVYVMPSGTTLREAIKDCSTSTANLVPELEGPVEQPFNKTPPPRPAEVDASWTKPKSLSVATPNQHMQRSETRSQQRLKTATSVGGPASYTPGPAKQLFFNQLD